MTKHRARSPVRTSSIGISPSERQHMAAAGALYEARALLLLRHRGDPQCTRLASALSAAADLLWPETVSKGKR